MTLLEASTDRGLIDDVLFALGMEKPSKMQYLFDLVYSEEKFGTRAVNSLSSIHLPYLVVALRVDRILAGIDATKAVVW